MTWLPYDSALVSEISANLTLRKPNELALVALAEAIEPGDGREVVCDLATGVGKTYLAAGLLEYLARSGIRNVLFVTPGTTIYDKTIANFTPGTAKYIEGRTVEPVLITADNFQRGHVGDALHDPSKLKLFVFNVQQLIRPTAKTSRRTRNDDEYIGGALYDHLRDADDLVVIADEHHVYRTSAKAFSAAIRDLDPRALVGLTATPDEADQHKVIFRYTLAEAIRDRLVKIPVIVYRQDGLNDWETQLADAVHLRSEKEVVWRAFAEANHRQPVSPVLFVVCQEIKDADKAATVLATHLPGDGEVLIITSQSSDEALASLATVEDPSSPVRAIVSVNKLREGWDVRNIGVIVGLRALASQTLTEQVLGRGLRLPFGERVGIGAIDQIDLVAHESYATLLKNKDALLERIAPAALPAPSGYPNAVPVSTNPSLFETSGGFVVTVSDSDSLGGLSDEELLLAQSFDAVTAQAATEQSVIGQMMRPKEGSPVIVFPRRERVLEPATFSVSQLDLDEVRRAGRRFSSNLTVPLTRRALDATVNLEGEIIGIADIAVDQAVATQRYLPAVQVKTDLVQRVAQLPLIEPTFTERAHVLDLVDSFLEGAGVRGDDDADWTEPRAQSAKQALGTLIDDAYARNLRQPRYRWDPQIVTGERALPADIRPWYDWRTKDDWYGGWDKNIVDAAKFDSRSAEYALARKIDTADSVRWWLRVYTHGPIAIPRPVKGTYYPDFVVIDEANVHWLVEAKSDKDAEDSVDVHAKREFAEEWAVAVREARQFGTWRYLFVTETDIGQAPSWEALVAAAAR